MESLSIEELERLKLDLLFLRIESVNLVREKARELLVRGVPGVLPRGRLLSPMGTRCSTLLLERLSVLIVSSPSMIAPVVAVWSRPLVVLHGGDEKADSRLLLFVVVLMCLLVWPGVQVKASHYAR